MEELVLTKEQLARLRVRLKDAMAELDRMEAEASGKNEETTPAHRPGDEISLYNADYGSIAFDCIQSIEGGKCGLYLFHYALPNMEYDAAEAAGRGEDYGNNDYDLSNIRAWQNSPLGDWWKRTHVFDAPPSYADKPGLLHGFSDDILQRIVPFENGDMFRLLSYEEVTGGIPYLQTEEGKKLLRKTTEDGTAVWWWLRSPSPDNPDSVRNVNTDGNTNSNAHAYNRNEGVAAACVIR